MTATNSAFERIREYLLSEANSLSLPQIVEKVRGESQALRDAAAAIPVDRIAERPAAETWSAVETFEHLLWWNERDARCIVGMIENGAVPPEPELTVHAESAGDFWQQLSACRERLFERVLRARGDEHLDVKLDHMFFGPLSWREWLLFLRVHDRDHIRQLQGLAERLTASQ